MNKEMETFTCNKAAQAGLKGKTLVVMQPCETRWAESDLQQGRTLTMPHWCVQAAVITLPSSNPTQCLHLRLATMFKPYVSWSIHLASGGPPKESLQGKDTLKGSSPETKGNVYGRLVHCCALAFILGLGMMYHPWSLAPWRASQGRNLPS